MNDQNQPLNKYEEVATHDDCLHSDGTCAGSMCFWENPRSYNTMLMCAHHAERADQRQDQISRNYFFDQAEVDY